MAVINPPERKLAKRTSVHCPNGSFRYVWAESSESVNFVKKSELCDTVLDSSVDFPTLCTLSYNAGCGW